MSPIMLLVSENKTELTQIRGIVVWNSRPQSLKVIVRGGQIYEKLYTNFVTSKRRRINWFGGPTSDSKRFLACYIVHEQVSMNASVGPKTYYWPGTAEHFKHMVANCMTCRQSDQQQTQQLMKTRPIPDRPWNIVKLRISYRKNDRCLATMNH